MKIYHGEGCKGLGFPLKILVLDFEDDWPQLHFSLSKLEERFYNFIIYGEMGMIGCNNRKP